MTRAEKKEMLEEMLKTMEKLDDIKISRASGYIEGMAAATEIQKEAS